MPKSFRRSIRWDTQAASYQVIEQAASTITASNLDFQSHVWQQWLEQVSSFAFQSKHGHHFTARKEVRARGDVYWIAYRKVSGRLTHKYLGRTTDVTLSRLEQVAATLAGQEIQATISELTDGHRENSMQKPLADQLLATKFFVPSSPHVLVSSLCWRRAGGVPSRWSRPRQALVRLPCSPPGCRRSRREILSLPGSHSMKRTMIRCASGAMC